MASEYWKIENGAFGISLTDPGYAEACSATISDFTAFTCQVTSAALNPTPNITDDTIAATWCKPESSTPKVGATSFEAAVAFLQDPHVKAGLSRTLLENDTRTAWIFMGLNGDVAPKAVAKVVLTAGAFGGEGYTPLTAEVTLPVDGYPMICYGDETDSESVGGSAATGATAGVPGTWTPAGSTPPATVADLIAGVPNTVVASPATAWTTGQYVQTATAGAPGQAHWSGSAWVAAPAALATETTEKTGRKG